MRWLIAVFTVTLAVMQIELWFGDDRLAAVRRLEQSVVEQSAANQALVDENADFEAEILDLRRIGEATEERARSELGLTYPGETFFQIAEDQGSRLP